MVEPHDEAVRERALREWASSKYAILNVDISVAHTDEDLANIATHRDSGVAFSWDEFTKIIFITTLNHPVDYDLAYNDSANDKEPVTAKGTKIYRTAGGIEKIYITHSATSATALILKIEGY